MFFKNKTIGVLSSHEQGGHEAAFLASLAAQVDYYSLTSHDTSQLDSRIAIKDLQPAAIKREGAHMVLCLNDQSDRAYDGIFIFRPAVAMEQLLPGLETDGAFVKTDRHMATNIPGVYACGDITGHPLQIAKAVGEGNIAAISCADRLIREEKT